MASTLELGNGAYYLVRQTIWVVIAVGVFLAASRVPLEGLRRVAFPVAVIAAVLLLAVLVPGIGEVRGGARRWIGLGPISLQPSEPPAKVALVLFLARWLTGGAPGRAERLGPALLALGVAVGMAALVVAEPDLGTALVYGATALVTLFVAGAPPAAPGARGRGGDAGRRLVGPTPLRTGGSGCSPSSTPGATPTTSATRSSSP